MPKITIEITGLHEICTKPIGDPHCVLYKIGRPKFSLIQKSRYNLLYVTEAKILKHFSRALLMLLENVSLLNFSPYLVTAAG